MLEISEVLPAGEPELIDALVENNTALTAVDRAEAAMLALEKSLAGKSYDLTTTSGDKEARQDRMRLVKLRTGLDRLRKEQNEEHKRIIDGNNAFAKALTSRIVALEDPIDTAIKAEEARKAAEKAERDRIERERILAITAKVQAIKELPLTLMSASSERLTEEIDRLTDAPIEESEYAEFTAEAGVAKQVTLLKLGAMRADAFEREAEAQRQREEAARLKAEREAQEAAAAQARAEAEAKAKAEREAAEAKAAADKAAADAIAQAAAEKLAEAQALLAEARRVQEENERAKAQAEEDARKLAEAQAQAAAPAIVEPESFAAEPAAAAAVSFIDPAQDESFTTDIPPLALSVCEAERPSDESIIRAVANSFEVDEDIAARWIVEVGRSTAAVDAMREAA